MSVFAQAGLLLAAALLQVTRPEAPNAVLALVVARAWVAGGSAGLLWALVGGLWLDLMGIGPLGGHALALLVAAYLAVPLARALEHPAFSALAGAAGGAAYGLVLLLLSDFLGLAQVSPRTGALLLFEAAATTAVLVPALVLVMRRVRRRTAPAW